MAKQSENSLKFSRVKQHIVKVKEDLTGKKFWEFIVIGQGEDYIALNGIHYARWICQCSCMSKPKLIRGSDLKYGNIKSCGCSRRKTNIYNLDGEFGIGWTTNTNREFYFDLEDYDKIKDYAWYEAKVRDDYHYIGTNDYVNNVSIRLHWIICGKNYDHKNRNPFDNRKENLRKASFLENARNHNKQKNNTSVFIGVSWDSSYNKWKSYIRVDGKKKNLGRFANKNDAVKVRLQAEAEYYGEFAPQRHLFEEYGIINNG